MLDNKIAATETEAAESELVRRYKLAESALRRVHDRVTALENRLAPMLTPKAEEKGAGPAAPAGALSPFGEALRSIEDSADHVSYRVEALLRKLAV